MDGWERINTSVVQEDKEHLSNLPLIGRFELPRLYKGHAPPAGFVRVFLWWVRSLYCTMGRGGEEAAQNLT